MSFEIDADLKNAVESFVWVEQPKGAAQSADAPLEEIINKIARKIIAASNLIPRLAQMAGRDEKTVSTLEAAYWIVQDKDKVSHETLNKIKGANGREKDILGRVFSRLSSPDYFSQLPEKDVKGLTLLMGIKEIAEEALAKPSVETTLESELAKLQELRNKYNIETEDEVIKSYLKSVDDLITGIQKKLAKEPAPKKVKIDET